MIVKAKYLGEKEYFSQATQSVQKGHFILVPQAPGHSEREIEIDPVHTPVPAVGEGIDVDTHDLPYKRIVPKGEDAARVQAETLKKAASDSAKALEISQTNAEKLDKILAAVAAKAV